MIGIVRGGLLIAVTAGGIAGGWTAPAPRQAGTAATVTFTDVDGNQYEARRLGRHYWMTTNFRALRTSGGEPLQGVFAYGDDITHVATHGRLYTWPAAMKAAPAGWHLPTREEWEALISLHGGASVAGGALKATLGGLWAAPNAGASNSSGFAAVGGGFRGGDGLYYDLGHHGDYWGTTGNRQEPYAVYMYNTGASVVSDSSPDDKTSGIAFSVRYLRD